MQMLYKPSPSSPRGKKYSFTFFLQMKKQPMKEDFELREISKGNGLNKPPGHWGGGGGGSPFSLPRLVLFFKNAEPEDYLYDDWQRQRHHTQG